MKKNVSVVAVLASAAITMSACGSSNDDNKGSGASNSGGGAAQSSAQAQEAPVASLAQLASLYDEGRPHIMHEAATKACRQLLGALNDEQATELMKKWGGKGDSWTVEGDVANSHSSSDLTLKPSLKCLIGDSYPNSGLHWNDFKDTGSGRIADVYGVVFRSEGQSLDKISSTIAETHGSHEYRANNVVAVANRDSATFDKVVEDAVMKVTE